MATVEETLADHRKCVADWFIDLAVQQEGFKFPIDSSEIWEMAEGLGSDTADSVAVVMLYDFKGKVTREDMANWIQDHVNYEFLEYGHDLHQDGPKDVYEQHEEVRMLMR